MKGRVWENASVGFGWLHSLRRRSGKQHVKTVVLTVGTCGFSQVRLLSLLMLSMLNFTVGKIKLQTASSIIR